jgi:L-fuconolactonase
VLQHFGANRCCCGGDWPVSLLAGGYHETWQQYLKVLSKTLTDAELKKVVHDNAVTFYNL